MASGTGSPISVVIDANVVIAICAKEADKLASAEAKLNEYTSNGCSFYAPGVLISECLYVFCKKLKDGVFSSTDHSGALLAFIKMMAKINPPPNGDGKLIQRAEEIRSSFGCSHSADGIYLALAEELSKTSNTEIVTFDNGMQNQAVASALAPAVVVLPVV